MWTLPDRAAKRERGDHRRWMWMATFPMIIDDPVLGRCEITFHPQDGRLYRPLDLDKLGKEPMMPETPEAPLTERSEGMP